jgi:dihydrofolate reductase
VTVLEIVYYVASSVDGFIAPLDGSLDWLAPFEESGEDFGYAAFYESVDSVLVGARTYRQMLGFAEWPYPGKPTWVFTHAPVGAPMPDVTFTAQTPPEVAAELAELGMRRAWLVGGGALAGAFQDAGLISEYIVSTMPVLLGSGVGLLAGSGSLDALELVDARQYPHGVQQARYRTSTR